MFKVTKKQNVILNGNKYIAVTKDRDSCDGCEFLELIGSCRKIPCVPVMRKDGNFVNFVKKGILV